MQTFHECSQHIELWISKQPHVKEESLTDWLLFEVSLRNPTIYYQAFSRHEEAVNGTDWEWWILTSENLGYSYSQSFCAYRFFVQAKKLLSQNMDNYPLIHYSNRHGLQIEHLTEKANLYHAFPLYMFYSATEPEIEKQKSNLHLIPPKIVEWCSNCSNGCFLSDAYTVYDLVSCGRKRLPDIELLNHSYKLSLLDKLFAYPVSRRNQMLSKFNQELIEVLESRGKGSLYRTPNVYGIKHYGKGIPDYLSLLIKQYHEDIKDISWFETEMKRSLPDVGGIGVIDLRTSY